MKLAFAPPLPLLDCRRLFRLKDPAAFRVAQPDAFRDMSNFRTMDLRYRLTTTPAAAWRAYSGANPLAIFPAAPCRVEAVYVPSLSRTLDRDALATGWKRFERGMKVFVDMATLPVLPWPRMMVGLEIVRIDARAREVEFRYLEGSPSFGGQVIALAADRGATVITHRTWYRSYSALVEALYPCYHERMLDAMHAAFARQL